jgi:predicted metalloprotease
MRWEEGQASGNVEDRRGMNTAVAGGGGIVGLIILAVAYFATGDLRQAKQIADKVGGGRPVQTAGPPPNDKMQKFSSTVLGYSNEVWADQFRREFREDYQPPKMVLFSQAVDTKCGHAPSAVGPFYCPADKQVYLDPTFFDELEKKLGGSKADFSMAYVITHEVGHHVQNLLGYNDRVKQFERREGENAGMRLELQADYLAGVCWHHVEKKHKILDRGDVEAAIKSAQAIGDDKLQSRGGRGQVRPDTFNHGTSAQRLKYLRMGLQTGDASKKALDQFFNPNVRPLDL